MNKYFVDLKLVGEHTNSDVFLPKMAFFGQTLSFKQLLAFFWCKDCSAGSGIQIWTKFDNIFVSNTAPERDFIWKKNSKKCLELESIVFSFQNEGTFEAVFGGQIVNWIPLPALYSLHLMPCRGCIITRKERTFLDDLEKLWKRLDLAPGGVLCQYRSLGALRAPTSSWRPFGPLDFVLRALRALRPCDLRRWLDSVLAFG